LLFKVFENFENWYDILFVRCGLKKVADIRLKRVPLHLKIEGEDWIVPLHIAKILTEGSLSTSNSNILLRFKNLKFLLHDLKTDIPCIYETFVERMYDKFSFKDKVILDIGAYIGDTAIFFAVKGAKKVIACEPNPLIFNILNKNVKVNNLEKVIITLNIAVGVDRFMEFFISSYMPGSTLFEEKFHVKNYTALNQKVQKKLIVKSISIKRLLDQIGSIDILKMDCEGCEFLILKDLVEQCISDRIREGIMLEIHQFGKEFNYHRAISLLKSSGFKKGFIRRISRTHYFAWAYK